MQLLESRGFHQYIPKISRRFHADLLTNWGAPHRQGTPYTMSGGRVHIVNQLLGHGASLDVNAKATNASGELALSVVVGGGRGCVLKADAPVAGIWIPLRGRLQLGSGSEA